MAIMIPDKFRFSLERGQEYKEGDRHESKVYDILNQLDNDYVVYHSYTTPNLKEIDFILIHPTKPTLFIEVKGGIFEQQGDRNFQKNVKSEKRHELFLMEDFFNRRESFKKFAENELKISSNIDINLLVLFTESQKFTPQIAGSMNKKILFGDDVNKTAIESYLNNLNPGRNQTTDDAFPKLKNHFLSKVSAKPFQKLQYALNLEVQIDSQTRDLIDSKLDEYIHNDKIIIKAPAGTGKTLLLILFAKRIAESSPTSKVLVTCFNDLIEKYLSEELKNVPNIIVKNFHNLCRHYINQSTLKADLNKIENSPTLDKQKFFNITILEMYEQALKELASFNQLEKFDAILVDEAQDFKEDWALLLSELNKPQSKIVICCDPLQKLINTDNVKNSLLEEVGTIITPSTNLRNTKSINSWVNKNYQLAAHELKIDVGPLKSPPSYDEGVEPNEINANSYDQIKSELKSLLHDLIVEQQFSLERITILIDVSSEKLHSSDFPLKYGTKIGPYTLSQQSTNKENTILLETGNRYKGKENLAIISIETKSEADYKKRDKPIADYFIYKYVTYSRAVARLFVIKFTPE